MVMHPICHPCRLNLTRQNYARITLADSGVCRSGCRYQRGRGAGHPFGRGCSSQQDAVGSAWADSSRRGTVVRGANAISGAHVVSPNTPKARQKISVGNTDGNDWPSVPSENKTQTMNAPSLLQPMLAAFQDPWVAQCAAIFLVILSAAAVIRSKMS